MAASTATPARPARPVTYVLDAGERYLVGRLFLWGFAVRLVVALGLEWSQLSLRVAPDELTYESSGLGLALYWAEEVFVKPWRFHTDQPLGYFYLNAVAYYLFGQTEVPIKLLNALIGAWSGRYVYYLSRDLFGRDVARRATSLYTFFPSLVLWSALNIRDVWVVFLVLFISCKSQQVILGYSHMALLGVVSGIYAITQFRDYLFYVVAMPPLVALLIGGKGRVGRNFLLALTAGLALLFLVQRGAGDRAEKHMSLETLSETRRNLATGGSAFAEEVDISTPAKALAFLPVGMVYFLFSPFPWQITSPLKALSVPEMLLVYGLTPAIFRGVRVIIKEKFRECLQILMLTTLLTISYALGEGNVGTLYRHRAQAMVFYLMFAAVGLEAAATRAGRRAAA